MNKENFQKLIDVIKVQKHALEPYWDPGAQYGYWALEGFNMRHKNHYCGTPSCIGGFAESIMKSEQCAGSPYDNPLACIWLGITPEEYAKIFWTKSGNIGRDYTREEIGNITPEQAVKFLELCMKTNSVPDNLWIQIIGPPGGQEILT